MSLGSGITAIPGVAISSFSSYSAGRGRNPVNQVQVNVGSTAGFSNNGSVYIANASGTNASCVNGAQTISSVNNGSLTINLASSCSWSGGSYPTVNTTLAGRTYAYPGSSAGSSFDLAGSYTIANASSNTFQISLTAAAGTVSGTASTTGVVSIPGQYNITSVSGNTIQVPLPGTVTALSMTSGTVTTTAPTVTGSYTIANVNSAANTFQVTLSGAAASITNSNATVTDTSITGSARNTNSVGTSPVLYDYPVIPGGYWVLPSGSLLANESASTRATAWPITYRLLITPAGLLSLNYSYNGAAYQPVLTNWPITTANGPLPSTFRFGFAGSTGGSYNVHEITCFVAQPTQSGSSAGANTVQAGQVRTGTNVYLASYDPNTWTGSLVSDALVVNSNGSVSVATNAQWDGNCVLTGGSCATMGSTSSSSVATANGATLGTTTSTTTTSTSSTTTTVVTTATVTTTTTVTTPIITLEAPASRNILTWSGSAGIPFEYSSLTTNQVNVLNSGGAGANVLDWLRGGRSNEQTATPAGLQRARAGVLGDIVDSSPVWVGPPSKSYPSPFVDTLYATTGAETSYATYASSLATRQSVVYVGSNDGMLHGFRAGSVNTDGSNNSTNNDGYEVLGFVPSGVLGNSTSTANLVALASPTYGHNFFVDGTPGYGDLFYGGAWHTWLVGSPAAGGAEIFALDITDPTGIVSSGKAFSESNAASLVVGDWTSSTITTCVNATTACGNNLGQVTGTPLVRRLHNGQWAIIFGNGLGSATGTAGVYIGLVNSTSGAVSWVWLGTGVGSTSSPNGIAAVTSANLTGNFVVDYLYAGDLQGNVWRFDLTSNNSANWAASQYGQSKATPLFVAKNSSGTLQPITSQIAATVTLAGGAERVILGFGTGRAIPLTATNPTTYQSGTQTVYGVWDWDMANWNSISSVKLASLPEITTSPYRTYTRSSDLANTLSSETATTRTAATSTVCWIGSLACTSGNTQYGWLFDLPDSGEQVIYSPVFAGGQLLVNTTIPPSASAGLCTTAVPTGWTMAFSMASGGGSAQNVFPDSSGSLVVASGSTSIVGTKTNGVGTPYVVSVGSKQYIISPSSGGGAPAVTQLNNQGGVTVKRISWEQLR